MASMMNAQTGASSSNSANEQNLMNTSHHLGLNHHAQYSTGTGGGFVSELVDPNTWDYYERQDTRSSTDPITSQSNSYTRPWEMDPPKDSKGFEPFSKLPSFQSQFHAYSETNLIPEPSLPQPVPVPVSPSSASPGNGQLTQLTPINSLQTGLTALSTPSFHTLTAVNTRPYPIVPAPIQARDIPSINQQYLDERHIQLYQPISTFTPQNVVTVIKKEPMSHYQDLNGSQLQSTPTFESAMMDNGYHNTQQNTPAPTTTLKVEKVMNSPVTRVDARKKERRKIRASSLESSAESESSAMEIGDPSNPGQVDAVSSTANFKSPMSSIGMGEGHDVTGEKQVSGLVFLVLQR